MAQTVQIEPPLKALERLLEKIPQDNQIRNVALILLDAYNLQFFGILADKTRIACAVVAVARFWVLEKVAERFSTIYFSFL